LNGTFQYFDNAFLYDHQDFQKQKITTFPSNTLQGYLQSNHPKWFLLLEKAGRLDFFDKSRHLNYTMFVPIESSIDEQFLLSFDKQYSLRTFNYHTLVGSYTKDVLETSNFQCLNTLIDGNPVYFQSFQGHGVLNRSEKIVQYNIQFGNVMIHLISGML
jgi:uncharacterized surface protein with fasciclin (FAS1) repeats